MTQDDYSPIALLPFAHTNNGPLLILSYALCLQPNTKGGPFLQKDEKKQDFHTVSIFKSIKCLVLFSCIKITYPCPPFYGTQCTWRSYGPKVYFIQCFHYKLICSSSLLYIICTYEVLTVYVIYYTPSHYLLALT